MKIDYGEIALLINYSMYYIERYIIMDNPKLKNNEDIDKFIKTINKSLNKIIQEINMKIPNRIIPFVKVRKIVKDGNQLRIILSYIELSKNLEDFEELEDVDIDNISLLLHFKDIPPQRIIQAAKDIDADAELIVDIKCQIAAAIDVFLDISMFHSYSFLDSMDLNEKRSFNRTKYEFFIEKNYTSFYDIAEDNPPNFLSLAFAARKSVTEIDLDEYIGYWDDLIEKHYGTYRNTLQSPAEQMKNHKHAGMIEAKYFTDEYWSDYSNGAYIFIRINREPNDGKRKKQLCQYFGIPIFHVGATKVVPISEYRNEFLKKQIDEHYVSAFKIVVA